MDELRILVDMVADLPNTAIWVLVLFFAYKVSIIGSAYGVMRLFITKLHSWLTTPKHELKVIEKDFRAELDGVTIRSCINPLVVQVLRIKNKGRATDSEYIHSCDVDWLRSAIDAKIEAGKGGD